MRYMRRSDEIEAFLASRGGEHIDKASKKAQGAGNATSFSLKAAEQLPKAV